MNAIEEMKYRKDINQAIDFDKVLNQIAGFASFEKSADAIKKALPNKTKLQVLEELKLAKEAMEIYQAGLDIERAGLSDIEIPVKEAQKSMVLLSSQLWQIAVFLQAVSQIKKDLKKTSAAALKDMAQSLQECSELKNEIEKCIDNGGNIKDDATSTLKQLSRENTQTRNGLMQASREFIRKNQSKLMEDITTYMGGRLCVLVKAQDKNSFGGMIHGQSQSGAAFYLEPSAFVSYNNRLQEIRVQIEEEKARILRSLSKAVDKNSSALLSDLETVTLMDIALAKGAWAYQKDGVAPVINSQSRTLRLMHSRHPLIDPKKVVANDYVLKKDEYCLMISGPNMGGKTVTLKTIGLFVALAHSGFPIIAHLGIMPWYESLWFDIGDNQSIENNLSTFSAHISKIAQITNNAQEHSFILLDEIGNGTDPIEGSALAAGILEYLIDKKSTVITSTHYNQVKAFGKSNPHVLVSSVEFDPESLKPTYRYIPGVSSSSYAFSIAQSFDLPQSILDHAKDYKEETEGQLQKRLETLEKQENQVRAQKEKFNDLIRQAHQLQKDAAAEKEKLELKRKKLEKDYKEQLESAIEEKQLEAQQIIDDLKNKADLKLHERVNAMSALKGLNDTDTHYEDQPDQKEFKAGDYVRIQNLNLHGEITEIKRNRATVMVNGKKMQVKTNTLEPMKKPNEPKKIIKPHQDKVFTRFPLELNLIGMHVDEAILALDRYLDQAVYKNIMQVRIIHGMGTGALRRAVWQDLAKQPNVKSYQASGPNEGGLGATVVLLK